jgi:hypothetical protein
LIVRGLADYRFRRVGREFGVDSRWNEMRQGEETGFEGEIAEELR